MATYDYSQFYKTKSPTGYDIFRSGGQKLSYEEATPMFQSGFNVDFIKEGGLPQSGGTGAGVPIGQSAAVSAKQAGLPGVPTGGVAGAPTFGQQAPIPQPPTTPVNISVSPEIDSNSLSLNNYRTGLNALLEENKKARESIMQQQEEARKQLLTSQQPTEQEYGIQNELTQLESGLSRLANQERKLDFGFLPEEYLKTEKGLQDVGISEAQLQRRIATEQAPIKRSFTDQRLDLLTQVESRQKALGLETAKRQGLYERAKTALGFAESDMNRIDKMMENQMQIESNILDYASKLDERSRQGLGTILKAFEGATQSFNQMSPQSQQGILSMAKQFGIDPNAVIAGIDSQVDGNMLGQAKTMLDMKKTQAEISKLQRPSDETYKPPVSYQEWNLAGSPGTYADWLKEQNVKAPTAAQQTVSEYAARIEQANPMIEQLEKDIQGMNYVSFASQIALPSAFQSEKIQRYMQSASNFINAKLRRESGAVIADSEFKEARKQYLPQPGDSVNVLADKKANRDLVYSALRKASGNAYQSVDELLGDEGKIILDGATKSGMKYKVIQ